MFVIDTGRHIGYELAALWSIFNSSWELFLRMLPLFILVCWGAYSLTKMIVDARFTRYRILTFLIAAPLCFLSFRGLDGIAMDPSWAAKAGAQVQAPTLAMNPIYNISWKIVKNKNDKAFVVFETNEVPKDQIFQEFVSQRIPQIQQQRGIKPNVVVVFLESWWGSQTRQKDPELTPFFNQLRKGSLSTQLFLAGGHRTTEGIFATLCSQINPLGRSVMYSELEDRNYECLPHLLQREYNFDSAFFQGSDKDTSGTGVMTLKTGFKDTYGKIEIPDLEKKSQNAWGVYDEDLYSFVLSKIEELSEPHIIGINTNTTHDKLVSGKAEYKDLKFPVQQADRELQKFYENLVQYYGEKPWILVLVADHTNYGGVDLVEHYDIPFLIKGHNVPGSRIPEGQVVPGVYHQIDVASTLGDLLGVYSTSFQGRSVLGQYPAGAGIYHNNKYMWFADNGDAVLLDVPQVDRFACFNYFKDPELKQSLPCDDHFKELHIQAKAYLMGAQKNLFK